MNLFFKTIGVSIVTLWVLVSCTKKDIDDQNIVSTVGNTTCIKNYNNSFVDVEISRISTKSDFQKFYVSLSSQNSTYESKGFYLSVNSLPNNYTQSIQYDENMQPIAEYIMLGKNVLSITVFDDDDIDTKGLASWWKCVKKKYKEMGDLIYSNPELVPYAVVINAASPGLLEAEVAVSASIWCLK